MSIFHKWFPDDSRVREYLESARWPDGIRCVHCGNRGAYKIRDGKIYTCKSCRKQFSIRTGTVLEDSQIPILKWLYAMYLLSESGGDVSSIQLAKEIKVTQKSAWSMLRRLQESDRPYYLDTAENGQQIPTGKVGEALNVNYGLPFPATVRSAVSPVSPPDYLKGLNTFVDMFCGIGGFHLAASSLGMRCVFACDVDAEARSAYYHNFGLQPKGDISLIKAEEIPDHDLFCAGFPCQPFSIIGQRKGFGDIRGTLFFEIVKILQAKMPRAVLLENVKQLTTIDQCRTINRIKESLEELGYRVEIKVLNALDFGLPQKRERVLIAATLDYFDDFPWPEIEREKIPLETILEENPDSKHDVSERIRRRRVKAHRSSHNPGIWHENKAGNISSYEYSCALRAGASYNYLLVNGERRLTPREMLRLQGFPDSFEPICTDSQTRKQVGNAVPVPLVTAGIEGILSVIRTASTTRQRQSA